MGLVCVVVLLAEGEQDRSGRGTPESWRNRVRWRLGREWGGRGGLRLPCVWSPHPLAGHVPFWAAEASLLDVGRVTSWLSLRRPSPCLWLWNSCLSVKA